MLIISKLSAKLYSRIHHQQKNPDFPIDWIPAYWHCFLHLGLLKGKAYCISVFNTPLSDSGPANKPRVTNANVEDIRHATLQTGSRANRRLTEQNIKASVTSSVSLLLNGDAIAEYQRQTAAYEIAVFSYAADRSNGGFLQKRTTQHFYLFLDYY